MSRRAVVVGAGVFGVTAALALRRDGWAVHLIEADRPPGPQAASNDVSKAIRLSYEDDAVYLDLGLRSLPRWREWNRQFERPLFHECGMLFVAPDGMTSGSYERKSFEALAGRGLPVQHLSRADVQRRFPAFSGLGDSADGFFNPCAGWAESAAVVAQLAQRAVDLGCSLERATVGGTSCRAGVAAGVELHDGQHREADLVVLAAGTFTPALIPQHADLFEITTQAICHYETPATNRFGSSQFPVWAYDISNTGWYGFPSTRGFCKVANHGPGISLQRADQHLHLTPTSATRAAPSDVQPAFRDFFNRGIPDLFGAQLLSSRLCRYCDTRDSDFLIANVPDVQGLVVATGGSGHGFKFAPVLGEIVVDVVERRNTASTRRFGWRWPQTARVDCARADGG